MNLPPFFKNRHNQAILALITANIIWGAASPIFKYALENIQPFTLAFLRFFGAMCILLPFAVRNLWIKKEDWPNLILLSVLGITINVTFFFYGLKYAPSINAPVIGSSGPIIGYLVSIFLLREKPHRRVFWGTFTSLAGILVIIIQPILTQGLGGQVLGNIFYIFAMLGAVGHSFISKKVLTKYHSVTITFWSFFIGQLTFFPFFLLEMSHHNPFDTIDVRGWSGLLYGIILSSAAAYYLFEWGIKRVENQEVGIFTYVDPIAAAIIAMPLLGEYITPVFILGTLLVFGGIFIAEGRIHYHPIQKLRG